MSLQHNRDEIREIAKQHGETNSDCSVVAISDALGVSYSEAHAAMKIAGRERGEGASLNQIVSAVDLFGFTVREAPLPGKTSRTVVPAMKKTQGRYFVLYSRHISGWCDGQSNDWSVTPVAAKPSSKVLAKWASEGYHRGLSESQCTTYVMNKWKVYQATNKHKLQMHRVKKVFHIREKSVLA